MGERPTDDTAARVGVERRIAEPGHRPPIWPVKDRAGRWRYRGEVRLAACPACGGEAETYRVEAVPGDRRWPPIGRALTLN